jgi:hypothetical protein
VGLWQTRGRRKMHAELWWTKHRGKDTFENPEIQRERERILLMWILNK